MHGLDVLDVLFGAGAAGLVAKLGVGDVKGILQVAGGVLLGHIEGVKVPEASLDKFVGGHLLEAHVEEDLAELLSHLVKRVEGASILVRAEGLEVVGLEVGRLPRARGEHVSRQVGLFLLDFEGELGALFDLEADNLLHLDQLALLQVGEDLGVASFRLLNLLQLCLRYILDRVGLRSGQYCRGSSTDFGHG